MKPGAFQAFHCDVLLTYLLFTSQSERLSPQFSVTTRYFQAYVRVSVGSTVSRKQPKNSANSVKKRYILKEIYFPISSMSLYAVNC